MVLLGAMLCVSAAKKKPLRLFMTGDSTMADKTELDISPERGWGQLFLSYLNDQVTIENHAKNGRSSKSFLTEGRWDVVMSRLQKGDVLIIQFGHNDEKKMDTTRYSSIEQYEANLKKMISEAQQKQVEVILCTSICRRHFKDGELIMTHGDYTNAARRVAEQMQVPLLDLEEATAAWLRELGDEASKNYYMNVVPGECAKYPEGKIDDTHLKEPGALAVGRMAAELIVKQKATRLARYVVLQDTPVVRYTTPCGIK